MQQPLSRHERNKGATLVHHFVHPPPSQNTRTDQINSHNRRIPFTRTWLALFIPKDQQGNCYCMGEWQSRGIQAKVNWREIKKKKKNYNQGKLLFAFWAPLYCQLFGKQCHWLRWLFVLILPSDSKTFPLRVESSIPLPKCFNATMSSSSLTSVLCLKQHHSASLRLLEMCGINKWQSCRGQLRKQTDDQSGPEMEGTCQVGV